MRVQGTKKSKNESFLSFFRTFASKLKTKQIMDDEIKDDEILEEDGGEYQSLESEGGVEGHSDYKPVNRFDAAVVHHLSGMYQNWFLDYASYVILERAVPNIEDGFKPVQRRIMHSMKRMDDGRYNKVANIVGHTMQFHPHGDASIGDALVQLGQKDLLVDTQGNWGNILTGDKAAAPDTLRLDSQSLLLTPCLIPRPQSGNFPMMDETRNRFHCLLSIHCYWHKVQKVLPSDYHQRFCLIISAKSAMQPSVIYMNRSFISIQTSKRVAASTFQNTMMVSEEAY